MVGGEAHGDDNCSWQLRCLHRAGSSACTQHGAGSLLGKSGVPRELRAKSQGDQYLRRGEGEGDGGGHKQQALGKAEARWGSLAAPHPRGITPEGG